MWFMQFVAMLISISTTSYAMESQLAFKEDTKKYEQFRATQVNLWHVLQDHAKTAQDDELPLFLYNLDYYFLKKSSANKESSLFSYVGTNRETFCEDVLQAVQEKSYFLIEPTREAHEGIPPVYIVMISSEKVTDTQENGIIQNFIIRLKHDFMQATQKPGVRKTDSDSAAQLVDRITTIDRAKKAVSRTDSDPLSKKQYDS